MPINAKVFNSNKYTIRGLINPPIPNDMWFTWSHESKLFPLKALSMLKCMNTVNFAHPNVAKNIVITLGASDYEKLNSNDEIPMINVETPIIWWYVK